MLKPEDISSLILQKLKARASDYLGREVLHAVVTVPAVFDHASWLKCLPFPQSAHDLPVCVSLSDCAIVSGS